MKDSLMFLYKERINCRLTENAFHLIGFENKPMILSLQPIDCQPRIPNRSWLWRLSKNQNVRSSKGRIRNFLAVFLIRTVLLSCCLVTRLII